GAVGITRSSTGTPLSVTRGDAEERTKLLVRLSGAALKGPIGKPAVPPKKRSLWPVLVGALVVLGAGGAAVLGFGRARRTDGVLRADTTPRALVLPPSVPPPPPPPPTIPPSPPS